MLNFRLKSADLFDSLVFILPPLVNGLKGSESLLLIFFTFYSVEIFRLLNVPRAERARSLDFDLLSVLKLLILSLYVLLAPEIMSFVYAPGPKCSLVPTC